MMMGICSECYSTNYSGDDSDYSDGDDDDVDS